MVFTISIILFPSLAVCMFINVLRIDGVVRKYGFDVFKAGRGPNPSEVAKIKKYLFYFFLSMLTFVVFIFIMAYIKQYILSKPAG